MVCLDCADMWCKVFYAKTETWEGYCPHLRKKVNGSDNCQYHRQLNLFDV